jgi:hypothetical protein
MEPWSPVLSVREFGGRCRLSLAGIASADGATLQHAGDELVARVMDVAAALERGFPFSSSMPPPHPHVLRFLYEIRRRAARGEDVRGLIFGEPGDAY